MNMKLNISIFVVYFLFVFVEEIIGEHSILFDLHPGYSNLIISIRFCIFFHPGYQISILILGTFPNERSPEFSTLGRSKSPMWSSASMGPLGPDLRGDVLPIFHERTHDYGRKGILDIYFVRLPGWIIFIFDI